MFRKIEELGRLDIQGVLQHALARQKSNEFKNKEDGQDEILGDTEPPSQTCKVNDDQNANALTTANATTSGVTAPLTLQIPQN